MNHSKNRKWRIYADKNVEKNTISLLRKKMDVLSVEEDIKLTNQEDSFHYKKAKQLKRLLLTNDKDFWSDQQFKLLESPGVIILISKDKVIAQYLPLLLRKALIVNNPSDNPIFLDGVKIKCSPEEIILKWLNQDSQKAETQKFRWNDLGFKL
ncbi:hypothetical protein LCGC14_1746400 [marine sediment metagenome]|uniref:DUF5615 domain-containing protein n=1 Tax=marine sediment metagenome TaxID=412755 RepID=A0A0F9K4L6_9ZZZZ